MGMGGKSMMDAMKSEMMKCTVCKHMGAHMDEFGPIGMEAVKLNDGSMISHWVKSDDAKKIAVELRNWVAKEIGPIAKPKDIRFGDNLPKTRSGKIMRRLLRVIAKGEEITQDTSTLENPAILDQLKQPL